MTTSQFITPNDSNLDIKELGGEYILALKAGNIEKAQEYLIFICKKFPEKDVFSLLNSDAIRKQHAPNEYTLIHVLSLSHLSDIMMLLKITTEEVTHQDNDGNTPLHLAVIAQDPDAVKVLMKADRFKKCMKIKNKKEETPYMLIINWNIDYKNVLNQFHAFFDNLQKDELLQLAFSNKKFSFAIEYMKILKNLNYPLPNSIVQLVLELKKDQPVEALEAYRFIAKWEKQKVLKYGKLILDQPDHSTKQHPADLIIMRSYYDSSPSEKSELIENSNLKTLLYDYTNFDKSPLIAPVFYIIALAAFNQHKGPIYYPKKPLKVIFTHNKNLGIFNSASTPSIGLYTYKSTLYVAMHPEIGPLEHRLSTLCHEATHMVANEIWQNFCNPFPRTYLSNLLFSYNPASTIPTNSNQQQKLFYDVLIEVKNKLSSMTTNSDLEKFVKQIIEEVFCRNDPEYCARELIVIVPQALIILGYDAGYEWLKQNTPLLLKYYENQFIPACINYLMNHHVTDYLQLSDNFKMLLESSTPRLTGP